MLRADQRIAILLTNGVQGVEGKTGLTLLRYRSGPIVSVIDRHTAGQSLSALTGIDRPVPIHASLRDALPEQPEVLVIGLAPSGGQLSPEDYAEVQAAVEAGLSIANGLHTRLADDPALQALCRPGQWIWDIRREPDGLAVGQGQARRHGGRRVLAVGTDMSIGKMSTCLELQAAAERAGLKSRFVGTGQAGILIAGGGVPLDAVRVDFASGAVEQAVLAAADADWIFVEGQGSLLNPASTATLPLLRGSQPTDLVLCHRLGQTHIRRFPDFPIPELTAVIAMYEAIANAGGTFGPCRVGAIALNGHGFDDETVQSACDEIEQQTGLPCSDGVRFGGDRLLAALQNR